MIFDRGFCKEQAGYISYNKYDDVAINPQHKLVMFEVPYTQIKNEPVID